MINAESLFAQTGKRLLDAGDHGKLKEILDTISRHSGRAGPLTNECRSWLLTAQPRRDGYTEVSVINSRYGLTGEVAASLFESLSTSTSTGLGMGLPGSKEIISEHGGQLTCQNNASNGVTFSFTLPSADHGDTDG